MPLLLCLFAPDVARAQRIPEEFLWFAGTSLLAPFAALPLKMVALHYLALDVPASRLWALSALEWVLWFPISAILLRAQHLHSVPIAVAALFAAATWLHRNRLAGTGWKSALLLSLLTPALAIALPLLTFSAAAFIESQR